MENQVQKELKVLEILENTNLNWRVNKLPLLVDLGEGPENTGSFGLFKSNTRTMLNSSVSDNYTVYQNHQMVADFLEICDGLLPDESLENVKGGFLKGGKLVHLSVPTSEFGLKGDTIKNNLTLLNSFDGSSGYSMGYSNVVVSCSNAFYRANADLSKVRHSRSMGIKLRDLKKSVKETLELEIYMQQTIKHLSMTPVKPEVYNEMLELVTGVETGTSVRDLSTSKANSILKIEKAVAHEFRDKGTNLWGLFNGITYHNTHNRKLSGGVYSGDIYRTNNAAFELVKREL